MSGHRVIFQFITTLVLSLLFLNCAAGEETNSISPLQIAIGQPISGEENQLAEVEGTVTFVGNDGREAYLEISSESGSMRVTMTHGTGVLNDLLLKSRVRVRGICKIARSATGKMVAELSATNANDITILQLPEETWQRWPLTTVAALSQTNFSNGFVHLRGEIKSAQPGISFSLADETGEIPIVWKPATKKMVGEEIEVLCAWRPVGANTNLHAAFFRPSAQGENPASLTTLTTTEQILWLKPDEAMRHYPVKLRGVATFLSGPIGHDGDIQDGSGGIYVWNLANRSFAVKPGDFCEIEGVTSQGDFSPGIQCRKVTVLSRGQFPEPVQPPWEELINGSLDAQWVEIQGVAVSQTNQNLTLGIKGGRIVCFISNGKQLERFLNSIVQVRGVVMALHDNDRHINGVQINVPSQEFISVETPAPADSFSVPLTHAKDLFTYNPNESDFRRVKIAGQIVHVRDGICYVMDGTNGMRLIPKEKIEAGVGDIVEAVGFPDIDSPFDKPLLTLRDAVIRKTGQTSLPTAIQIAPDDLLDREHDSTLVQTGSRLLGVSQYRDEEVLELQTGAQIYRARLNTASGQILQLRDGSVLQVTGVYANSSDKTVPFELLLNSPADVRVLELPSWWTARHAAMVVGGMTLIILFGIFWITILHQQVNRRTIQLSKTNRSLQDEISERKRMENELVRTRLQNLVEQERTRIARDIHDELGCNLSQIRLLSEMTLSQNNAPAEVQDNTGKISTKALETTRILDEIVWAVDPQNDTLESLMNYLFSFASDYLALAGIRFRIDAPTKIPHHALTTQVRHQLYMAVKEMLTNVVNHSRATEVRLRLALENDFANFEIEDNGCGFKFSEPDANPNASGLNNMRKRFREIGGDFDLHSEPNRGTRIKFSLPLKEKIIS